MKGQGRKRTCPKCHGPGILINKLDSEAISKTTPQFGRGRKERRKRLKSSEKLRSGRRVAVVSG